MCGVILSSFRLTLCHFVATLPVIIVVFPGAQPVVGSVLFVLHLCLRCQLSPHFPHAFTIFFCFFLHALVFTSAVRPRLFHSGACTRYSPTVPPLYYRSHFPAFVPWWVPFTSIHPAYAGSPSAVANCPFTFMVVLSPLTLCRCYGFYWLQVSVFAVTLRLLLFTLTLSAVCPSELRCASGSTRHSTAGAVIAPPPPFRVPWTLRPSYWSLSGPVRCTFVFFRAPPCLWLATLLSSRSDCFRSRRGILFGVTLTVLASVGLCRLVTINSSGVVRVCPAPAATVRVLLGLSL